jgi:hypothetical protein
MLKRTLTTLVAALALTSLPAAATDNGFYLGASAGLSSVEDSDTETGFKVIAGWRFLDWLAIEGNYIDFGSGNDTIMGTNIETDASGLTLSAVGFLPVGPVDLFARVGVIDWDADVSSSGFGSFSDSGTDLTYGIGAQFRIWSLSLRGEYEIFDLDGTDTDMFSLGVTYTFF